MGKLTAAEVVAQFLARTPLKNVTGGQGIGIVRLTERQAEWLKDCICRERDTVAGAHAAQVACRTRWQFRATAQCETARKYLGKGWAFKLADGRDAWLYQVWERYPGVLIVSHDDAAAVQALQAQVDEAEARAAEVPLF